MNIYSSVAACIRSREVSGVRISWPTGYMSRMLETQAVLVRLILQSFWSGCTQIPLRNAWNSRLSGQSVFPPLTSPDTVSNRVKPRIIQLPDGAVARVRALQSVSSIHLLLRGYCTGLKRAMANRETCRASTWRQDSARAAGEFAHGRQIREKEPHRIRYHRQS